MYDIYYSEIKIYYYKYIYNNFLHISLADLFDLMVNNSYCIIIVFKIIVLNMPVYFNKYILCSKNV